MASAAPALVGATAAPAPGIALPRRRPARPAPSRRRSRGAAAGGASPASRGLALRAVGAYERISSSALLDRLLRGRVWIGALACALIGIVAMQLVVLELNAGIGRTLAREAALQRADAQLGIEDATGTGEARVEPLAAATGMTFAPSGSVHFVTPDPSDVGRAAAALAMPIQAPSAAAQQASEGSGASVRSGGGAAGSEASNGAEGGEAATPSTAGASGEAKPSASAEASGGEGSHGSSGGSERSSGEAAGGGSAEAPQAASSAGAAAGSSGGVAAGQG